VNFLVRSKLGLLASWQMPESDFLTAVSAAIERPGVNNAIDKVDKMFVFNISTLV
jgi:hypothetical protein